MIDKLTLATNEIDIAGIVSAFPNALVKSFRNNQYYSCFLLSDSESANHLLSIYTKPTLPINEVRLEMNPAKLGLSYIGLMDCLRRGIDLDNTLIQRIDHASDLPLKVEEAFNTVRFKFKRNLKYYCDNTRGNLNGFYIGSKHEQILIYDKKFQLKGKAFKASSHDSQSELCTRFEIRQKFQSLPIRHLGLLPELLKYDPYRNLETYELEPLKDGVISNGWKGLHLTYQELNVNNNIKRDLKKYLVKSGLKERITSGYWANLGHFFNGGENEAA